MSETIYISVDEVIEIHERMVESTGGSHGLRDRNRLESAVMLPQQTFDQVELYPTIIEKAAILALQSLPTTRLSMVINGLANT